MNQYSKHSAFQFYIHIQNVYLNTCEWGERNKFTEASQKCNLHKIIKKSQQRTLPLTVKQVISHFRWIETAP